VIRQRVVVAGVVQGVFFRDTCRRVARHHGVAGWVRNLPDGRVEAVFEGDAESVDHLVGWMHRGPAQADVTSAEVLDEAVEGLRGFEIR
jgi:acylphosphatase